MSKKYILGEYFSFFNLSMWNYFWLPDWVNLYQNNLYQNNFVSKQPVTPHDKQVLASCKFISQIRTHHDLVYNMLFIKQ